MYSAHASTLSAPHLRRADLAHASKKCFTLVEIEALSAREYINLVKECAAQGWTGDRVYDAIHIQVARKMQCSRIYTFNVSHFRQIAPDLTDRIMAP